MSAVLNTILSFLLIWVQSYIITEKTISYSELEEEIGQVSQNITTVEGNKLRYGYVYNIDETTDIAVNINEKYYIAELAD